MKILLNKQETTVDVTTVAELINSLPQKPEHFAVALNSQVVPKSAYAQTTLHEGDKLEIFTLMAGG